MEAIRLYLTRRIHEHVLVDGRHFDAIETRVLGQFVPILRLAYRAQLQFDQCGQVDGRRTPAFLICVLTGSTRRPAQGVGAAFFHHIHGIGWTGHVRD